MVSQPRSRSPYLSLLSLSNIKALNGKAKGVVGGGGPVRRRGRGGGRQDNGSELDYWRSVKSGNVALSSFNPSNTTFEYILALVTIDLSQNISIFYWLKSFTSCWCLKNNILTSAFNSVCRQNQYRGVRIFTYPLNLSKEAEICLRNLVVTLWKKKRKKMTYWVYI